jgi:transcriptional regulator GlxA family with amidase domain
MTLFLVAIMVLAAGLLGTLYLLVEAIRVDAARRRLEETDDRIESIAEGCGFSSEEQMRCAFLRILRIPPRDYRKRFS